MTYSVTILILPESSMMCVASVLEPLRAANRVAGSQLYDWKLTSLTGDPIELTCDIRLDVAQAFGNHEQGDLLVVIGGFNQGQHVSTTALTRIRSSASAFSIVAGVEAGSWILARAGLLDGHSATTHWEDYEAFSTAFSEIDVRLDRYVIDENRMTCGGASPAFDMMLDMVRNHHGAAVAMEAASVFIYDEAHSAYDEQPLVSLGKEARKEQRLELAVRLMEKWIEQPLPVAAIAKRTGISSATLETIFKRHTGLTPGKFYLNLRLKAAKRMVLDSSLSFQEIAVRTGFNSLSAFSRAYRKAFGQAARNTRTMRG